MQHANLFSCRGDNAEGQPVFATPRPNVAFILEGCPSHPPAQQDTVIGLSLVAVAVTNRMARQPASGVAHCRAVRPYAGKTSVAVNPDISKPTVKIKMSLGGQSFLLLVFKFERFGFGIEGSLDPGQFGNLPRRPFGNVGYGAANHAGHDP